MHWLACSENGHAGADDGVHLQRVDSNMLAAYPDAVKPEQADHIDSSLLSGDFARRMLS